ncbi:anhydro-N-acetylmuramic acid kinase [Flavobacteriaceae bacterium M23B6Z8]
MKSYNVIGLMSGTSLDGLDMVYAKIYKLGETWKFEILKTRSIDYQIQVREKLKNTVNLSAEALLIFNNNYGEWLGKRIFSFIEEEDLKPDLIASHGHTVFHQPEKGLTYQIGSGQAIANRTGIKTVCDFRSGDLLLGGQGAPFVPIGDHHFFSEYDFCLNLGGISNFSFQKNKQRFAYDISPANMLLNHIIHKIGKPYDHNGEMARSGMLRSSLLDKLNALSYYKAPFPKSLGYEWFQQEVIPIIDKSKYGTEDLLHTSVHHIAEQIAANAKMIFQDGSYRMLATGGGAKNGFLMEVLQEKLGQHTEVIIPETTLIDFKEALVFGLMGVLRLEKEINVLASVTGGLRNSSSGVVYLPI